LLRKKRGPAPLYAEKLHKRRPWSRSRAVRQRHEQQRLSWKRRKQKQEQEHAARVLVAKQANSKLRRVLDDISYFIFFKNFLQRTYALYVCSMLGRFRNFSKGRFFIPYFLVAQSTRLGAAIAVPPFVFEKNVILPRFFPVPPFAFFVYPPVGGSVLR
jgi:hypothetical protein